MQEMPRAAAWRHRGAREGFEVVFVGPGQDGRRIEGSTVGVEEGEAWEVSYGLEVDEHGRTRAARVSGRSIEGSHAVELVGDGHGRWRRDGEPAPELDGCLDVDLEASAFTNALPVRRLGLAVGEGAQAPAVWVRTVGLGVERLDQRYERVADEAGARRAYDYSAPELDFRARLVHDERGLGLEYPGLAVRAL